MNDTVELQTVSREANEFRQLVIDRLGKTLIDLDSVLEQVLVATIAEGHVL